MQKVAGPIARNHSFRSAILAISLSWIGLQSCGFGKQLFHVTLLLDSWIHSLQKTISLRYLNGAISFSLREKCGAAPRLLHFVEVQLHCMPRAMPSHIPQPPLSEALLKLQVSFMHMLFSLSPLRSAQFPSLVPTGNISHSPRPETNHAEQSESE